MKKLIHIYCNNSLKYQKIINIERFIFIKGNITVDADNCYVSKTPANIGTLDEL